MRLFSPARAFAAVCLVAPSLFSSSVSAIDLDPTDPNAVKKAAKTVVKDVVAGYANDDGAPLSGITGLLTYPPYYWWNAGHMFGVLVDYWYYTGDDQYNELVRQGMAHQMGENNDLMPQNASKNEGNDDQLFWTFSMISAAEYNFPAPPEGRPSWLAISQSVFNQLVDRWNKAQNTCNGGLRWQIFPWLPGWDYKNMASNGGMFHLGARLALFTGNDSYAQQAEEVYKWLEESPLITDSYQVNDGTDIGKDCVDADQTQWTYNYGIMISGAAYMYNYTNGSEIWRTRLQGFLNNSATLFPESRGSVMTEVCEPNQLCDQDQVSFKATLARFLALATQLAPWTHDQIMERLRHSAVAAAQTCVGESEHGAGSNACGNRWYWDGFDGNAGVGQQMAALSMIQVNLVDTVKAPYTASTGGTSKSNPGLGTGNDDSLPIHDPNEITTADKAGAGILTALALGATLGGAWFMVS